MNINLTIDATQLILRLDKGQRRLAYAVVNAINATAKRIQVAEQAQVLAAFTVRKEPFIRRQAAVIRPFASVGKARPFADIELAPPGSGRGLANRRLLLGIFERGGERLPFYPGSKHVAVPITGGPARPTFGSPIDPSYTFSKLGFRAYRGGKLVKRAGQRKGRQAESLFGTEGRVNDPVRGGTQWKGKQRTFIAMGTNSAYPGAVLQRFGPKRGDVRTVYAFRSSMKLAKRLHWLDTATSIASEWFAEEMQQEANKAIAWARGKGL